MKKIIFFLIVISLSKVDFGQTLLAHVSKSFGQYAQTDFREKIYAHTDKNFYVSGDIIWYKLYCTNAATNSLSDVSKIAYTEILNANKQPVLQVKTGLKNGVGEGSFYIPVNTPSGNYIIRVYTNWMKNFPAELYFEKQITIVNTLINTTEAVKKTDTTYDVQFFPEGGNLVEGINSKIAFKVTNQYNKGIVFNGALLNQHNDTIVRFKPARYGIGSFNFTPKKGDSYRAIIVPQVKKVITKTLPDVYPSGYVMHFDNTDPKHLKIKVNSNIAAADSAYLFITCRDQISMAMAVAIINGSAEFPVNTDQLSEGISRFTIFNQARQPVCERLYFKAPTHYLQMNITPDNTVYSPREKVTINITTNDESQIATMANMSLSVYRADSLSTVAGSKNILNYLWLGSELKGDIEDPQYYITEGNTEAIDNLMLTHGWRRFNWDDILANKREYFKFLPEYEGHILTGRITHKTTQLPCPDVLTYMAIPGKRVQLYTSKSNKDGSFTFVTHDLYGRNEIVMHPEPGADSLSKIEINNPFSESYSSAILPDIDYNAVAKNTLLSASIAMQVRNIYTADSLKKTGAPAITGSPLYQTSRTYLLDNYNRYTTMSEIFQEVTPELKLYGKKNNYSLKIADLDVKGRFAELDGNPLLLVDGIPVFNNNQIADYDPLKIQKIETVYKRLYSGQLITNGIINFITYKGDMAGFKTDNSYTAIDYEGVQMLREFYSPVYNTTNISNHIPDYRTTLLWAPNIRTDQSGKVTIIFYTSDQPGEYNAVLEGITPGGKAGVKTIKFKVTK